MSNFLLGSKLATPLEFVGGAVDSRTVADSVSQVLNIMEEDERYLGMTIFIEDENKLYQFAKHVISIDEHGDPVWSTGLTDDDFQPLAASVECDMVLDENSVNAVANMVVKASIELKQDALVPDDAYHVNGNMDVIPTKNSERAVTSGGVHDAIQAITGGTRYRGLFDTYSDLQASTDTYIDGDWVIVTTDETKENHKCKYMWNTIGGVGSWIFMGYVSEIEVSIDDIGEPSTETVWSSLKTKSEIDKTTHTDYVAGIDLVSGCMYMHNASLYLCNTNIPAASNISWSNLPVGTMTLKVGSANESSITYDPVTFTLVCTSITMQQLEYNRYTETLSITTVV